MSVLVALGVFVSTAYCHGSITASGTAPRWGTVAAPREYAFGTQLVLDGSGWPEIDDRTFVVTDRGGDIWGRRLDLYIPNCARALEFGRKTLRVSVLSLLGDGQPEEHDESRPPVSDPQDGTNRDPGGVGSQEGDE